MDKREAPRESGGFLSSLAVLKSAVGLWFSLVITFSSAWSRVRASRPIWAWMRLQRKAPWSVCQQCSPRGADLPTHMDSFFITGVFFSQCFHTCWPESLAHCLLLPVILWGCPKTEPTAFTWCLSVKQKHFLPLEQLLRCLSPLTPLQKELFLLRHCQGYWT